MLEKIFVVLCAAVAFAASSVCAQEQADGGPPTEKYFGNVKVEYSAGGGEVDMPYQVKRRKDGAWRVRIPKGDFAKSAVDFIDVKIPACYAKKGEEGFFINTQNAIGAFKKDGGNYSSNGHNFYAFFGMKNPRCAWVAIVKKSKLEFSMVATVENGEYCVFPRFEIKRIEGEPYEDIVVDFYELRGKDASYAGMAKKYRAYQIKRGEVRPLKERVKDNPKLEAMAKSILVRAQHGGKGIPKDKNGRRIIKDYTPETELPIGVGCTFDEVAEVIRALKESGCDNIVFHEVGWNKSGHDGRYPQLLPVEPKFGGEEALKRTIETAKSLGYYISPHVNHTDAYRIADCWSEDYIAKRADGSLMYVGCWAGGKAYTPCPQAIFDRFVKSDYVMLRDRLGFNGLHHVDVISAIAPRVCHDKNHPLNRKQWAAAYLKIMEYAHEITGGFTSEAGYDHVITYLDWGFYINFKNSFPDLFDRIVPVWQLVYHGIVPSSAFHTDVNNNLNGNWEEIRLHHAEFGGRPVYYLGLKLNHVPSIASYYAEYQPMARLQMEFMDDHRKLAEDVYLTVYADGSEVLTNYSRAPFEYRGKKIPPRDYMLFNGGIVLR